MRITLAVLVSLVTLGTLPSSRAAAQAPDKTKKGDVTIKIVDPIITPDKNKGKPDKGGKEKKPPKKNSNQQ